MVLFIYDVEGVSKFLKLWLKFLSVTIQMIVCCGVVFSAVLFLMLYKSGLNFEFADDSLNCFHSNESY